MIGQTSESFFEPCAVPYRTKAIKEYPTFTPISNLSRNDVFGNNHLHGLLQSSNQKRSICDIVNTSKMHQYPPFTSISYRRANHCFQNVPRCHCSRLFEFIPNWQFFECVWLIHAVPRWQRSATALHSFRSAGSRMYQPGFCKPNTKFAAPAPPKLTYFKYPFRFPVFQLYLKFFFFFFKT